MDYFPCTESNTGPILDVIWAGLNVVSALIVASDPSAYESDYALSPDGQVAVGLSWGAVSGVAAGVGFNKSKQCRAARRLLAQRQAQGRVQPMVQAVVLSPQVDTLRVGERVQLTATAHSSSGAEVPSSVFTWSSSNDAVASVSDAGLVTAHAPGAVVVAARTGNVLGTATIVVLSGRSEAPR